MRIEKIIELLQSKKGQLLNFKYNGARNQTEFFSGYIDNLYKSIFTINVKGNTNSIRCFNYSDILIKTLEIL